MKLIPAYKTLINASSADEVFTYLIGNLNDSITLWDYFVNWNKVFENTAEFEMGLNTLNYLVGKDDIEQEFKILLRHDNSIAKLIPLLLACRENEFKILADFTSEQVTYETFNFAFRSPLNEHDIDRVCLFASKTGLLELFKQKKIKSIPDYVLGVEVGLDTNGRKNRHGTSMENLVLSMLETICKKNDWEVIGQANAAKIKQKWGISLTVDKSSRRFDFAIKANNKLVLLETNYYGGSGSKLKATAGEYKTLHDFITKQNHSFIWITDGKGWKSTLLPLRETFNHVDYLLNLKMVTDGVLYEIIRSL
jgi:type II restriction enzyme